MKKIIKQISILMAPLIVIAMAVFGSLKSSSNNSHNKVNINQSIPNKQSRVANAKVTTPNELFVTYPINASSQDKLRELAIRLVKGLIKTSNEGGKKLYTPLVQGELEPSLSQMLLKIAGASGVSPDTAPFTERGTVLKINNYINNISTISQDKTIAIKRPLSSYDVLNYFNNLGNPTASGAAVPKPGSSMEITIPPDFTYKVATIDMSTVPEGKSVMFDLKDGNKDTATLVIQNDQKQLTDGWTIKEMAELGDIYFRKTNAPKIIDNPTQGEALDPKDDTSKFNTSVKLPSGVTLVQEGTNISIYIEAPADKTKEFDFSINKSTDQGSKSAIKFGILDHSLSPMHMKSNSTSILTIQNGDQDTKHPLIPNMPKTSKKIIKPGNIKGFHSTAKWAETKYKIEGKMVDAEVLTLYMSEGAKIAREIKFNNKGKEAFEGNANQFALQIESNSFINTPKNFKIIQSEFSQVNSKVKSIKLKETEFEQTVGNHTKKWFKIEIAFPKGIINFLQTHGGEAPFRLKKLDNNIFFSEPTTITGTGVPIAMPVIQYTDNSKENIKIIGSIYANWAGLYQSTDTDFIKRAGGILPLFHVRHEGYKLMPDGALKHTGLKNEKWDPVNAINELNKFSDQMSDWAVTKLNTNPNAVREGDFYKMFDASTSGGFVKKRFIDGSNSKDVEEVNFVTELARKRYNGEPLDQEEIDYKNPYFADSTHPDGKRVIEFVPKKGTDPDAKSKMYEYIEPILSKIISDRFDIEKATFDTLKSELIAGDIIKYLKSSNGLTGINNKALKRVNKTILNQKMDLLALNGNSSIKVNGGRNQLKSLIEFIKDFDLQTKYLGQADASKFNQIIGLSKDAQGNDIYDESKNQFIDNSIWENVSSAPQPVYTMVVLLDKIIKKISGNDQKYQSISSIIDDILSTKIQKGGEELGNLLNDIIKTITSTSGTKHYEFFGRSFSSSYMQNLAVGYNLSKTINRYLKDNDAKLTNSEKIELGKVDSQTAYDPKVITRVAINNKYYNIPYFIDGMSKEDELKTTIEDLLKSDLAKNVTIKLPETNKIVDFLSNPTRLATMGFMAVGALLTIIGGIITFISFKNKPAAGESAKKLIIMRSIFIGVTLLGIIILAGAIMLPVLTASGKLAILAA